jgi:AraC-like DNA-binding protein
MEPRWWEKQNYVHSNPVMHLGKYQQQLVESYYQFLSVNLISTMSIYRRHILQAIARAAVLEVLNYIEEVLGPQDEVREDPVSQGDFVFRQFLQLLQEYKQEREVQFFAEKIGITPKYLTEICKQCSGKLPTDWIAEVTMTEIVRLLWTTQLSVKEIAYDLHFPNSSFFCQYVKKHTGKSPLAIRRETK